MNGCIFSSYILKEIFVYACWKTTITRIEKLSLISKQVFKIIQQIHTHYQHLCMNSISYEYLKKKIGIQDVIYSCESYYKSKVTPTYLRSEETYQYNLFQNTSLQQLVLKLDSPHYRYKANVLNQFKVNHTLNTLGLDIFDIQTADDLAPLLAMPNIHTLVFNEDLTNDHVVQDHIKLNKNITSLQWWVGTSYNNFHYQAAKQMFDSNQGLQSIYVFYSYKISRYTPYGWDKYYNHC